ncbi:MAG TPA: hypothetical protein VK163_13265 [Opitutaceae bacterium]|nr:hypothetical protein [Opitutaceae bacterium]
MSGKGVAVAKLRQDGVARVVLFAGANVVSQASSIAVNARLRFDSVEQLYGFLRVVGAGVSLQDGGAGLGDDAGIVERFTSEERALLRLDGVLADERDLEQLQARRSSRVTEPIFDWIRSGVLYWVSRHGYQYRSSDGRLSYLSGDPGRVAALISAEFHDARRSEAFVRDQLPDVMARLLGPRGATAVTASFLERRSAAARGGKRGRPTAGDDLLAKHVSSGPLVVSDGHVWSLTMPVLNADGSIERWEADGVVSHFTITTLRRTQVAPAGSVTFVRDRQPAE